MVIEHTRSGGGRKSLFGFVAVAVACGLLLLLVSVVLVLLLPLLLVVVVATAPRVAGGADAAASSLAVCSRQSIACSRDTRGTPRMVTCALLWLQGCG